MREIEAQLAEAGPSCTAGRPQVLLAGSRNRAARSNLLRNISTQTGVCNVEDGQEIKGIVSPFGWPARGR
jgi:hypothetical protein